MDAGDFIYWIIIAVWVLSKIVSAGKKDDDDVAVADEPLPDLEAILAEIDGADAQSGATRSASQSQTIGQATGQTVAQSASDATGAARGTSSDSDMDGGALLRLPGEPGDSGSGANDGLRSIYDELRRDLSEQIEHFIDHIEETARLARVARATTHIATVMEEYSLARARALRDRVKRGSGPIERDIQPQLEELHVVQDACETFVRQRQLPEFKRALGDADELARACYEPISTFAHVNRLELTSAYPVSVLTGMSLGLIASFVPTGLAPITLPRDFFADIRWWPAIAHEIGHDFFACTKNSQNRIRAELGIPAEATGARLITAASVNYIEDELIRIFGAWFEEIFCDVFGTMMMGPAYGYSMVSLFAEPDFPEQVTTVRINHSSTGYAEHPPRHLRVMWCARLLELKGEEAAADEIRAEWHALHGELTQLVYPTLIGNLGVPTEAIASIGYNLIDALYSRQFEGLDGHSLRDIPGLEYSVHRAAEARRSREEMLAGRAPSSHPTRAVIAGAVLAWHQQPERQAEFMALARRAVVGVTEHREDAYDGAADMFAGDGADLQEAFLLHTLLAPPPSLRAYRGGSGFLSRRQWPPR